MIGARPWWFPTLVFAVPIWAVLTIATFVVGLWSRDASATTVGLALGSLALGPGLTFVHLGRAEDRARDATRSRHLNRWGGPRDEVAHPWRRMLGFFGGWGVVIGGVMGGAWLLTSLPRDVRAPIALALIVLAICAGLGWLAWSLRNGLVVERNPLALQQIVWRWPVTLSSLAVAFGCGGVAVGLRSLFNGNPLAVLYVVVWAYLLLGAYRRLRNPRHPDRNYGRAG